MSFFAPPKMAAILCCTCGLSITPNAAAQCAVCLAAQFDLTSLLNSGDLYLNRCRRCLRYQQNGGQDIKHYQAMDEESAQLMALCLKQIPAFSNHGTLAPTTGLSSVKLVDSTWVWTEPHSKRLKLKLVVRASLIVADVEVQQRCLVTFVERNKQCEDCNKEFQNQTWQAIVQLREKRPDDGRKNLARMELALAKSKDIRRRIINLEISKNGFDFYFSTAHDAQVRTRANSAAEPLLENARACRSRRVLSR